MRKPNDSSPAATWSAILGLVAAAGCGPIVGTPAVLHQQLLTCGAPDAGTTDPCAASSTCVQFNVVPTADGGACLVPPDGGLPDDGGPVTETKVCGFCNG